MPEAVLIGKGLSVAYGGVKALSDVDIEVRRGEVVGLIGPNGAGKTSFIDGVTGFATMSGDLRLDGTSLTGVRAHRRSGLGLSRTWQSVALFDDLTVRENVAVAAKRGARRSGAQSHADRVQGAMDRVGIAEHASRLPGELSHGQRVLVGVARAIAAEPQVVLMDEPAAGLDDAEGRELGLFIRKLASEGMGILLVDHDMNLVLDVCDRLYVLDFGRLIASGSPQEISNDPAVIRAYLGGGDEVDSADPDVVTPADIADADEIELEPVDIEEEK
ncbi:ABC transporter ATP-binding protein [Subtercola endophyticus]|uniref:ABC transporter ATP-binding protein n=1 Tax=Subtercola endophyticus TaxID=2895559 RepID=UPI001E593492|nr:ABC transporter ATP-binding protein [Subtercola endophyticus]UFS59803.1 ABC transporter ATP-binding protein [Subtercola endophyticus]